MTLAAPVPASAQAIGPDPKAKPLNCASQVLPLPRRVGGPRYGEGAAESQDWEQPSPRRKLWSWLAVASSPQSGPALPLPILTAPPGAPPGKSREAAGRGAGKQRQGLAEAAAMREQEQPENAGSSPGATWRQPAPAHPLSSRVSATRSQPGRAWGASPAGPSRGYHPGAREQKSKDEALDTGAPTGQGSARGRAGRVTSQKSPRFSLPNPTPGWLPTSASSPQDPQTPAQTWLRKLPHPAGEAAAPTPRKATCEGKQWPQQSTSPHPTVAGSAWAQMGLNGRRGRPGQEQGPGTLRWPLHLARPRRARRESGHTLVTSPDLGPSALCPEPLSAPHLAPTPVNSLSSNRKNKGRGWGGGSSWSRGGQAREWQPGQAALSTTT